MLKNTPIKVKLKPKAETKVKSITEWRNEWCWIVFPISEYITLELCIDYKPADPPKPIIQPWNTGTLLSSTNIETETIDFISGDKIVMVKLKDGISTRELYRDVLYFERDKIINEG